MSYLGFELPDPSWKSGDGSYAEYLDQPEPDDTTGEEERAGCRTCAGIHGHRKGCPSAQPLEVRTWPPAQPDTCPF